MWPAFSFPVVRVWCLRHHSCPSPMADINKVLLHGRVARDPVLRTIDDEKQSTVCNVTVATNRRWKHPDGTPRERTEFTHCEIWGPAALSAQKLLRTGAHLFVEGHLETTGDEVDGVRRSFTKVVVENFTLLDPKPSDLPI